LANSSELFQNLRKYVRGQIDRYELDRSDASIERINENTTRGLTEITFSFGDSEKLFRLLGLNDDDIMFARYVLSSYGDGWTFRDSSMVEEDFFNGYVFWGELNDENKDILKQILRKIDPAETYEDFDEEESKKAAATLLRYFDKETHQLYDEWNTENERQANEAAREGVQKDLNEVLGEEGFKLIYDSGVKITVGELIMLYLKTGKVWLSFKQLFKEVYEGNDSIGGWSDDYYEWEYKGDFDKESFNRSVNWILEKMLDKLEDIEGLEEFVQMVDRIKKKYKPGVTYELPKLKNVSFRIRGFDKDDMKIDVVLRTGLKTVNRKVSEENFYNLLYQPELFQSEFGSV
jgi:hypothetical protein